jgi:hypothetical protein
MIKIIHATTIEDQKLIAIHVLNPTFSELEDALEQAERDLFPMVVIHTTFTWPKSRR